MYKSEFLKSPVINAFVEWFAEQLSRPTYPHAYKTAHGKTYTFDGLEAAMKQYDWRFKFHDGNGQLWQGNSLAQNQAALDHINYHLQRALAAGDDEATRIWSTAVMGWGGVMNGNSKWLSENVGGLSAHITGVRNILDQQDDADTVLKPISRFNAGMTKVYSLLCNRFIIYDSRVAAALAWFVSKWCSESGRHQVPEMLAFPCLPAKEAANARLKKVRNPSTTDLRFPALIGAHQHAKWNQRASWVLDAALTKAATGTCFGDNLRALEASLFMWGYDLGTSCAQQPKQ